MVIMVAWCRMHLMLFSGLPSPSTLGIALPEVDALRLVPRRWGFGCCCGDWRGDGSKPIIFQYFPYHWGMGWKYLYLTPYLGMNIHKSQPFPSYFDILQDTRLSMPAAEALFNLADAWSMRRGVLCGTFMCLMHCLPNLPRKHMPLCCYHCYYGIVLNEMSTTGGRLRCFWPMRCATAGRRGAPELQEEISRMKVDWASVSHYFADLVWNWHKLPRRYYVLSLSHVLDGWAASMTECFH